MIHDTCIVTDLRTNYSGSLTMTTSTHHCSSCPAENLAAGTHPKAYGTYTYLPSNASHPIRCVVDRTNASKLVRALHTSRDPQRFGLLQDTLLLVHDRLIDVMERDHWLLADADFCADMAAVFFGIALDSSSYVFEGDEREVRHTITVMYGKN